MPFTRRNAFGKNLSQATKYQTLLFRVISRCQHTEDRNTNIDQSWDRQSYRCRKGANLKTSFWNSDYLEAGSPFLHAACFMHQPGRHKNQLPWLGSDSTIPEL